MTAPARQRPPSLALASVHACAPAVAQCRPTTERKPYYGKPPPKKMSYMNESLCYVA